jgi:hypothetical protein
MARSVIPNALTRREWLEQELDSQRALRVAEAYLAEERPVEAIAFLAKAGAGERLEAMRQEAVRAGDAFLLTSVCRMLETEPTREEWRELGEAAAAAGKETYAAEARRQVDRMEG